jgi:hypothetical protein
MNYPTMEQVQRASLLQIYNWKQYLPSPGVNHLNLPDAQLNAKIFQEMAILEAIYARR